MLVKIDHRLRNNDDLTARYVFQQGNRTLHFVPSLLGSLDVTSPDFGRILNTLPESERQLQFGLRVTF
jgi:hypothetical protein